MFTIYHARYKPITNNSLMLLSELDYTNYTMLLVSAKNQILKDINIYYKIFFNNKMVIFYLSFHVEDKS